MARRIALAGKPLAGKTTLANLLQEKYGYRHATTNAFIVDQYAKQLNEPWMLEARGGTRIEAADIYANKEAYRAGLQVVGDDLGYHDPEQVVGVLRYALEACGAWSHPEEPVVLEAIRGELQASAARALGFVVVEVWVDEDTQRIRAGSEERYLRVREAMRARPDIERGIETAEVRITPALSTEVAATLMTIIDERGLSHGPASQPFTPGSLADWRSL